MKTRSAISAAARIQAQACAIFVFFAFLSHGADWHEPEAGARVVIRKSGETPESDTGYFLLWPEAKKASGTFIKVMTESGQPARHRILWAADGEPLKVMFDCAAKQPIYYVYFVEKESAGGTPFEPGSGLVLETRKLVQGPIDTWEQITALWTNSAEVLGRSVVPNIFHGMHLHGETRNFMSYYKGQLNIEKGGDYSFAVYSDDASCLMIDGRMAAAWPGAHNVYEGMRAKYSGNVKLNPGRHKIEYYNVELDYGFSVAAAWKPPDKARYEVIPPAAFAPVSQFAVEAYETRKGRQCYMTWDIENHSMAEQYALVSIAFNALGSDTNAQYEWIFDDGTKAEGQRASHVFFRQGIHAVTLNVRPPQAELVSLAREINVRPNWAQQQWSDAVFEKQKEIVMARDMSRVPMPDLVCLLRLADAIQDRQILSKAGTVFLQRQKEIPPEHLELLFRVGKHFQHPEVRSYDLAQQCFTAVLGAKSVDPALLNRTRLHFAGFLIYCRGDNGRGKAELGKLNQEVLSDTEKRLAKIYEADALLGEGHKNSAYQLYAAAGTTVNKNDAAYAVKRRLLLETAKAYCGNGDYDAAEQIVRQIEWETPLERLNTETGLIMVKVHIGRAEYPFALSLCNRLLNAAPFDSNVPAILYNLVEIAIALGDRPYAAEIMRRLKKEHPYSEATALAIEKWKAYDDALTRQ